MREIEPSARFAAAITLGVVEFVGLTFLLLMDYLYCVWFIDDSLAFRMSGADWVWLAAARFLIATIAALPVAALCTGLNSMLFRWAGYSSRYLLLRSAVIIQGTFMAVSLIGAAEFAIRQPFM